MGLDAIIIADSSQQSLSGSSSMRFELEGRTGDIQVILNYLENEGKIVPPVEGDGVMSWSSAPKLNGIFLYSYLTKQNFQVEVINNYVKEKSMFRSFLGDNPKAVIISTTFIYSKKDLCKLVEDIRSLAADIFIIAGGPFVYMSYQVFRRSKERIYGAEAIKDDFLFFNRGEPAIDLYIISLRGEKILIEALNRIKRNQQTGDLPNSGRFVDNKYHFTHQIDDISNSENTSIEWKSLPDRFFSSGVIPMQASAGCPHKCAFCNFTKDSRLLSIKPIEELISELRIAADRHVKYVWFVDDNFRLGKGDINSVCRRIVDEGLQIRWMSFIRADTLVNVNYELLRTAGCGELQLGLESGASQILKNMNKQANPEIAAQVIHELLDVGINCSCYFIVGFPGETDETVLRTLSFIQGMAHPDLDGLFSWSIYPFMLAPMSPIYGSSMRNKYKLEGYMHKWEHETMNSAQAREHVRKAFFSIKGLSPIYRGDNQDMLTQLPSIQRHEFMAKRHELSKHRVTKYLNPIEVVRSFREVFS